MFFCWRRCWFSVWKSHYTKFLVLEKSNTISFRRTLTIPPLPRTRDTLRALFSIWCFFYSHLVCVYIYWLCCGYDSVNDYALHSMWKMENYWTAVFLFFIKNMRHFSYFTEVNSYPDIPYIETNSCYDSYMQRLSLVRLSIFILSAFCLMRALLIFLLDLLFFLIFNSECTCTLHTAHFSIQIFYSLIFILFAIFVKNMDMQTIFVLFVFFRAHWNTLFLDFRINFGCLDIYKKNPRGVRP